MKKFIPIIISLTLFVLFLLIPSRWVDKSFPFSVTTSEGTNLNETTFKGTAIQNVMFKEKNFYPLFGSSELEKKDPFHPVWVFRERGLKERPFLIGTGGSTDLIHAINIASHIGQMKDKKMAIIISPQWFTDKGIDDNNFSARYSPQQVINLFSNPNVPPHLKTAFAKRLSQFDAIKNDSSLNDLVQENLDEKLTASHPGLTINQWMYKNSLDKNDIIKAKSMIPHTHFGERGEINIKNKSWSEARQIAVEYGQKKATNNPYYMRNQYYNMIQSHQKKLSRPDEFFQNSPEFGDLELLLAAMTAGKADPLFISIPANGKWYDHIDIPTERRQPVYDKIHRTISNSGFKLYDLTDKEYEPYVLSDAVHIGWKGWVYIDEQMVEHIENKYQQQK
ncbi:D-alanyl-lipoteichoic acid biosynthesis protein DltD [Macrococcus hajekii]|uniref:Protein DltD n=1 Tax=Macrococcus hajekii TaxID=198482 RepID=A0A4R6BP38_9STAP|nr:D-alanyl-lipoteichoic acid biosynthesis protein DltD [Macrococcus hajekii]TDM03492.1 D-alanyl-lipoteichoic acid biosynthesis protein DltD [Macrococcus hajekii]GGA99308.1 D-alanyl-lipoteichoic acid biosynthesis protein DltD [Macrococcus hajekii]